MRKKDLLPLLTTLLIFCVLAFPVFAEGNTNLPMKARLGNIFELAERFAFSDRNMVEKNNAVSSIVGTVKFGLYDLEEEGKLEPDSVDKFKSKLYDNLTSFQAGFLTPEKFVEEMGNLYREINKEVEKPVISVNENMALGKALEKHPDLTKKAPKNLSEKEVSTLVKTVSSEHGVELGNGSSVERDAESTTSAGGNGNGSVSANSSGNSSSNGGELDSSGDNGGGEPGLTQGKWKDPKQVREDNDEKQK